MTEHFAERLKQDLLRTLLAMIKIKTRFTTYYIGNGFTLRNSLSGGGELVSVLIEDMVLHLIYQNVFVTKGWGW